MTPSHAATTLLTATTLAVLCAACTGSDTTPGNAQETGTGVSNMLKSSVGLTVLGQSASAFPLAADSQRFGQGNPVYFTTEELTSARSSDGTCNDTISLHGPAGPDTQLATKIPAEVVCDLENPDNPEINHAGVQSEGVFHRFDSTASLVPGDGPRQTYALASDGTTAYWFESVGIQAGSYGWRLFAADLSTGKSQLIARVEDAFDIKSATMPDVMEPMLTEHNGRLYFLATSPTEQYRDRMTDPKADPDEWADGDFEQGLFSLNVDGSDLQLVKQQVGWFRFSDSALVYTHIEEAPTGESTEDTTATITTEIRWDEDGTETVVAKDIGDTDGAHAREQLIKNVSVNGTSVAFTRGATLYVADTATAQVELIQVTSLLSSIPTDGLLRLDNVEVSELALGSEDVAILLTYDTTDRLGNVLVTYDYVANEGTHYELESEPYQLAYENGQFSYRESSADGTQLKVSLPQ